ncbi:MAG TPA: hypothetical protein VFF44_10420 [Casimicrobiaceae bacterium]|nr:hypothetical protein [Casimicrobiaceae bacterium]
MLDTALLAFAMTMVASPPQFPPKSPKKPIPKIAQVQKDQRFADFAKAVLKCYHPTARYQGAAIERRPWAKQKQYGARGSALVSIQYVGVSNAHYSLVVGVLAKPEAVKTVIDSDTAVVKAYENCELADWVDVK